MANRQQKIDPPVHRNEIVDAWLVSRREHPKDGDKQREKFLQIMRAAHKR